MMRTAVTKAMFGVFKIFQPLRFIETGYWKYIHGFRPTSVCSPEVLDRAFKYAKSLHTLKNRDYYEFGTFKGYSIWKSQQLANTYGAATMKFYGFDSFCGLPKPAGIDDAGYFYEGQYNCAKATVIKNIKSHGGDLTRIHLIEGYFDKSLKKQLIYKYKMKPISIVYIDCDLYSSTKDVLSFIKNLLIKDSLILFDDWNAFSDNKDKGEQLAFYEFKRKNPDIKFRKDFSFCWHGQAFRVI